MSSVIPMAYSDAITATIVIGSETGDPGLGPQLLENCDHVRVFFQHNSPHQQAPWMDDSRVTIQHDVLGGIASAFIDAKSILGYHLIFSPACLYPYDYVPTMIRRIERYKRNAIVGTKGGFRLYPAGFRLIPADEPLARDLPVHELDPSGIAYHAGTVRIPRCALGPGTLPLSPILGGFAQDNQTPLVSVNRDRDWVIIRPDTHAITPDVGYGRPGKRNNDHWRLFAAGCEQ